jgi:hypothetical protein
MPPSLDFALRFETDPPTDMANLGHALQRL